MSALNTAMNAIGTVAALKSLLGGDASSGPGGRVASFISQIRESSVARTNLFDVTITSPRVLTGNPAAAKISLFAQGTSLPGLNIQTSDIIRFGYGPHEKIPYTSQTNDLTVTFIGDGRGQIYKYFYNWMQGIVRSDYPIPTAYVSKNALAPYEVEFKSEYSTTIVIKTYDEQNSTILEYELTDAFPINLPEVALSWSESSMMQFSVTFAYLQSRLKTADAPAEVTKNGVGALSPFQQLVKIGTAVQAISSLRAPTSVQDALSSATTIKNVLR
jgi:hypothetical protein